MGDGADRFAQDIVYPAFSPTLGLFLAISTAYGVWKVRAAGWAGWDREVARSPASLFAACQPDAASPPA